MHKTFFVANIVFSQRITMEKEQWNGISAEEFLPPKLFKRIVANIKDFGSLKKVVNFSFRSE